MILWDTNKDHKASRFNTPVSFFKALKAANESGRGFRIAYTGEGGDLDFFEKFCAACWSVLDGQKLTYIVVEEYGAACEGSGAIQIKRHPYHKRLWQESRKYGGIILATSQRPQSISKDAVENAGIIMAGNMGLNAAKRIGQEIDVNQGDLRNLNKGEFYRWELGREAKKLNIFKKQRQ